MMRLSCLAVTLLLAATTGCATEADDDEVVLFEDDLLGDGKADGITCRLHENAAGSLGVNVGDSARHFCVGEEYTSSRDIKFSTTGSLVTGLDTRELTYETRPGETCKDNCYRIGTYLYKHMDGSSTLNLSFQHLIKGMASNGTWETGTELYAYIPKVRGPGHYRGFGKLRTRVVYDGVKANYGLEYSYTNTWTPNCTFDIARVTTGGKTNGTFTCEYSNPSQRGPLAPYTRGRMTMTGSFTTSATMTGMQTVFSLD